MVNPIGSHRGSWSSIPARPDEQAKAEVAR
jgi:hypothetical protein